ncbi:MAG: hypothetical protein AAF798_09275 [Bacteroidota bacterium]
MRKLFFLAFLLFFAAQAQAQLQKTQVFLFDIEPIADTSYRFSNPRYLTGFNANGYNNHPSFVNDSLVYISSQQPSESQPDIYELNLNRKTLIRVTSTAEGEFSPAQMPDEYNFSAVRQEFKQGDTLLRVWQFPIDRVGNGKPIMKYFNKTGYYEWIDGVRMAIFNVEDPNRLSVVDTRSDEEYDIARNVGRCFRMQPNGKLAYVQKSTFGDWTIMEKNIYQIRREPAEIIQTLPGSEDFAVTRNGIIFMAKGSKIYKFNRYRDQNWVEIADLRFYEIRDISRLRLNYDDSKIAIVGK